MDFHNLKRRELQSLCRKHQIPANLTNKEMAERLTALSAVDEKKPLTRGRSCLKSADDIVSGNESDLEVRPAKKVKFSPENETIEFEKSAVRYSQVNGRRRRKSAMSGDKGSSAEEVNEEVREPGVSGRGKSGGVKGEIKGGKRGKKVDASKSSEVVDDRVTRLARRRLLIAEIGVEGGGRKVTEVEVIKDNSTTSDVTDGGHAEARRGKSLKGSAPGTKADSSEEKATIQNVEVEDTEPKRGRPGKRTTSEGMLVATETGKMAAKVEASKAGSSEDKATIQNVENEDAGPRRGRSRGISETGKIASKVEASKEKELVVDGLNENAKQVRRSRRGKSVEKGVQIDGQSGKEAIIVEAVEDNGLVDDGVTGEVKRVTRSRRGKSPEGMQIEGKAGNRATKVDDGAIGEVKGVRRSRRGKSPEGTQVELAKIATKDKALKSKGVVIDGSNEDLKEVKSVKGKSSKEAGKELAKDAVTDKGLVAGLSGDAKDVRQSRRGKSAAGMQVENKVENKVAKDEDLLEKVPVDDGLHGDAKEVRRSRRGKSAEGMLGESTAVKKLRKDEALKDQGRVDDGLVRDAKEVRSSKRGKSPEGMQVETKAGKKVTKNEALLDKGITDHGLNGNAKVDRSSRRRISPEMMHIESKIGKTVTKDEVSKDQGIVDDGLNGDAKEVRRSRRGKSPEVTKVKKVTMDDPIKNIDLVDGLSVDAREARRISRRRNFTAGIGVSEGKPSAAGDVPSENIHNEEHIVLKKPLLSKRGTSTEEREQDGGVRKRSKKSSNVTSKEDCGAASGSNEAGMEVADVQLEAGVRSSNRHVAVVDKVALSENATKSKDVQRKSSSKVIEVKECSPAESKLRRSQRSASKLELSVQSTSAVTIRNSKMETRKKGGAVFEFKTHITQESNSNRRLSKKNARSTGKGEMPLPATETEKSTEEEEIRSMGYTANPADPEAQAASLEGPTKTNIEDEDTSNVDIPSDLNAQDILAEDSIGKNIEVEDASNVGISSDVDAQAALAENPTRVNIGVVDTSNVDIPSDLDTQAVSVEDTSFVEVENISNVDIPADADAESTAIEARTDSVCDNGTDAQLSAILPQFESTISAESHILVERQGQALTHEENYEANDPLAAHIRTPLTAEEDNNLECVVGELDEQCEDVTASTNMEANSHEEINEGHDSQATPIRKPLTAGKDCLDGNSEFVIDESCTQHEGVLVSRDSEAHSDEETAGGNDSQTQNIRTPLTVEYDGVDGDLELTEDLDKHHETSIESPNAEPHSQTTHMRTPLTLAKDYSAGNSVPVIGESCAENEAVLKSRDSEAHSHEERAEGNDSQTKNIRIPLTAENDGVDGDLELTDDLDKHHETSIESPNAEPLSQTTHMGTPLTAGKDYSAGNSVPVIGESHAENEAVPESRNFVAHSHEERAEGHDSQTKNIRTPSSAENVCVVGDLELTDDLDKHHEPTIKSTSEAHSHEGNDSQAKHIKTPLSEEKDCGDGSLELGVAYLDKQHKAVLGSIDSEVQFNEERYDGNDLIGEKDFVKQREEVSTTQMKNDGAHYSSAMLTNFHHPDMSSFEDAKTDEIESSKMTAENSEKLLEHESPDAIRRRASEILLDRDVNCCEVSMRGDMLYYAEPSPEGFETETKFSGVVFDTKIMEPAQTSPSLGPNGKATGEAIKAVDLETHLVMSAQSPSEQNRGALPNLDQGVRAAKSNEQEDMGHLKPQDSELAYSLESHEENSYYYKSNTDGRTSVCHTQDQVEEAIAACDTQRSPGGKGTQIVDGGEGYEVCSEAKIKEGSGSVEAVFMMNTPSSGGDAEMVKGTVSMDITSDAEAYALDDQPALRTEGEASCQAENSEGKDSMRTYTRTPLAAEKDHMECSLYHVNDAYDKQHAAVKENTSSEAHSTSPSEVNEEMVMFQNCEGKERMQPNLEALKYSEPENSEILIDTYDVGSSYNVNDGQPEAMQMQTTLNANESKQEEDTTMLAQPAEVLPMQMNSCGLPSALENYEHQTDSFEDLKSVKRDSSEIVPKNSLGTVGRSTSINELQGEINIDENIRDPSDMQGDVLAFNEPSAKRVGIATEFSGIADDSGTESFRNSYTFDWDGFGAEFDNEVHGFSFGGNIPPEDCEGGYRYPLDHAKDLEGGEQGTSLFETQVNEHQLNTNESVSNIQAPDISDASVSGHYPLFSASEVTTDLLSEIRSDIQNCASQPEELDQGLLETAAGSILDTEAHQCTGNADEALDHNLVSNFKSDFSLGNSLGGAASESISSAAIQAQKSKDARNILIQGTPTRPPATAHPRENASVSKVGKVGSLTSVRTAKPPPSACKPWK